MTSKNSILILVTLAVLIVALVGCTQGNSRYSNTSNGEYNKSDYLSYNPQAEKQLYDGYADLQTNKYVNVRIAQFKDSQTVQDFLTQFNNLMNPARIDLGGKYVSYIEQPDSNGIPAKVTYIYASNNNLIQINSVYFKACDQCDLSSKDFVVWYYSKYPNSN